MLESKLPNDNYRFLLLNKKFLTQKVSNKFWFSKKQNKLSHMNRLVRDKFNKTYKIILKVCQPLVLNLKNLFAREQLASVTQFCQTAWTSCTNHGSMDHMEAMKMKTYWPSIWFLFAIFGYEYEYFDCNAHRFKTSLVQHKNTKAVLQRQVYDQAHTNYCCLTVLSCQMLLLRDECPKHWSLFFADVERNTELSFSLT